jgi:hypothetical protein
VGYENKFAQDHPSKLLEATDRLFLHQLPHDQMLLASISLDSIKINQLRIHKLILINSLITA